MHHNEEKKIYIVLNCSDMELIPAMHKLLNRALNFSVQPHRLDITQFLVDFNRFARSAIWQEYWFGKDTENQPSEPIFKKKNKITYLKITRHHQD